MQMNLSKGKHEWETGNTHSSPLFAALQAATTQTHFAYLPRKPWERDPVFGEGLLLLPSPAPPFL